MAAAFFHQMKYTKRMEVATLILLVLCFRRAQETSGHAGLGRCAPATARTEYQQEWLTVCGDYLCCWFQKR